jgi:orotidine 5'-phosphate decarboxylase subfamily 2
METTQTVKNAGLRLWTIQQQQRTQLCIGLDPHFSPDGPFNHEFYRSFAKDDPHGISEIFRQLVKVHNLMNHSSGWLKRLDFQVSFFTGLINYFFDVIDESWRSGIRLYKPNSAFYELFADFGSIVLQLLVRRIRALAASYKEEAFIILDAKRGDIDSTQLQYYTAYLLAEEIFPGMNLGDVFGFDTMTVTTWMGRDVLTPGLPFFRNGKGAIVVTRSSNPSGTMLQDTYVDVNSEVILSKKQEPFRLLQEDFFALCDMLGRRPMEHEVMLYETERFSEVHELNNDNVSPLFSVMGSTVAMDDSFRIIRPRGIALVPGFGTQKGTFANIMRLLVTEGPLMGHLGILASSRDHNFPWRCDCGSGNPKNLKSELATAIESFRKNEKEAYAGTGLYPFS